MYNLDVQYLTIDGKRSNGSRFILITLVREPLAEYGLEAVLGNIYFEENNSPIKGVF